MVHADFTRMNALPHAYRTSNRLRVHALLPRHFEQNGKGEVIRASFGQARTWTRSEIPQCEYLQWIAVLDPESSSRQTGSTWR